MVLDVCFTIALRKVVHVHVDAHDVNESTVDFFVYENTGLYTKAKLVAMIA